MSDTMKKLGVLVARCLLPIRSAYAPSERVRLTLILRDTLQPDGAGDAVFSDEDSLDEVRAALTRLDKR